MYLYTCINDDMKPMIFNTYKIACCLKNKKFHDLKIYEAPVSCYSHSSVFVTCSTGWVCLCSPEHWLEHNDSGVL